ncbi:MAG TPA: hypothetical protein VH583_13525 [Vicinamibacterales bacterium]
MNENDTTSLTLKVRIVALPGLDEVDELDLRRRFRIGEVYELPVQVGAVLIIAGYGRSLDGLPADSTARR